MPLRVIAGEAKGRPLRSLRGMALRPTPARVRAALFSALGDRTRQGPFLDLYAGTGAVGIEALSRGAPWADFVEQHGPACRVLAHNLAVTGLRDRARIVAAPVARFLGRPADRVYAVVFADPPYGRGGGREVLSALAGWSGVTAETLVVVQHQTGEDIPVGGWRLLRRNRYGRTTLSFYRLEGGAH